LIFKIVFKTSMNQEEEKEDIDIWQLAKSMETPE
jgi:hypothetical protein